MPFTFSHPAIVLPLSYAPKRWFSLTALVAGSLVPDFEYFIRMRVLSLYSHTIGGLFWFDLPVGLLMVIIYNTIVKNPLIDSLPKFLNTRFAKFKNNTEPLGSPLFIVMISLLTGAISHLLWDSFTHPTGYFVVHIEALQHTVVVGEFSFPIYKLLQHTSSALGAAVIIIGITQLPVTVSAEKRSYMIYWAIVAASTLLVLAIKILTGLNQIGNVVVTLISGGLLGIITASAFTLLKKHD